MLSAAQHKNAALWIALAALAVGIGISANALKGHITEIKPVYLAAVLVTVPLSIVLSSYRFRLVAALAGTTLAFPRCLRTVVLGTAVNFLPVPGGFAVRVHALRHVGVKKSVYVNVFATLAWLIASSLLAFAGAYALGTGAAAGVFAGLAAVCAVIAAAFMHRHAYPLGRVAALFAVQSVISGIDISRMVLIAYALSISLGLAGASVLGLAGVIGTMTGIMPSGIGITESVGALLLLAIGASAATGFLITALNRLSLWVGIAPAAVYLLRQHHDD